MKNKSNKQKLYFGGEFIKDVKFDREEKCYLLNANRYYLGKKLVGLLPFDLSFFAYKGEIINLLGQSSFQEDYFKLMTAPIPKKNNPKKEKLIFEIEQTSFSVENNHGFIKLKIPYGYSQIEHIKKGMKVILKTLKDK